MSAELSDIPTNEAVPRSHATLTIRIIKSFEFRTEKSLVLKDVNCEETTVGQLKEKAKNGASTSDFASALCLTLSSSRADTTRLEAVQKCDAWYAGTLLVTIGV